jgi:hypothetical protein
LRPSPHEEAGRHGEQQSTRTAQRPLAALSTSIRSWTLLRASNVGHLVTAGNYAARDGNSAGPFRLSFVDERETMMRTDGPLYSSPASHAQTEPLSWPCRRLLATSPLLACPLLPIAGPLRIAKKADFASSPALPFRFLYSKGDDNGVLALLASSGLDARRKASLTAAENQNDRRDGAVRPASGSGAIQQGSGDLGCGQVR